MATNYQRGYNFEYRCRKELESKGFFVVRSAGSKGPADLVAIREGKVLLVQCKLDEGLINAKERDKLLDVAAKTFTVPVLAEREKPRGPINWVRLDGEENVDGLD